MKNTTKKEVKKAVAPKVPAKKAPAKAVAKKKPVSKKKKTVVTNRDINHVEMISYSMKMVIPTGAYANIQPEITVNAFSPEIAEAYIAPHMNKLWKEYYMCSERPVPAPKVDTTIKPASKPAESAPEAPVSPVDAKTPVNEAIVTPPAPASAVALNKASQAVASCTSKEALDLIATQVEKSVKLTDENKVTLRTIITEKQKELV